MPDFSMMPGFIRVEPSDGKGNEGIGEEWFEWEILLSRYVFTSVCVGNRTLGHLVLPVLWLLTLKSCFNVLESTGLFAAAKTRFLYVYFLFWEKKKKKIDRRIYSRLIVRYYYSLVSATNVNWLALHFIFFPAMLDTI